MDGMTFDTLLRAAVLIIPQGVLKSQGFKKHFWAKIAARVYLFVGGIVGKNLNQFYINRSSREPILTTVILETDCINYRLCTKMCTKLARLVLC